MYIIRDTYFSTTVSFQTELKKKKINNNIRLN